MTVDFRLDNIESYSSAVKAAQKVLKEVKKRCPKEINCYRLRVRKTIYFFTSFQKMKNKLEELDDIEYELAKPGEQLPPKKLKL